VYLELVITHRWSRSGWIEGLVYQARVNFLELMQTPKGEPDFERSRRFPLIALRSGPPHVPVTVALDREILCLNIATREMVKKCKRAIRNPLEKKGPDGWKPAFEKWRANDLQWIVSISKIRPLPADRSIARNAAMTSGMRTGHSKHPHKQQVLVWSFSKHKWAAATRFTRTH
jgi:hypothetical protein